MDIHYVTEGEGPPVVLIHGVGAGLASWDAVAARLAGSYRIIRPDLRGHGRSAPIVEPFSLRGFSEDVAGVLDRECIGEADVVGFSLGGLIAQRIALDHPQRVRRLALLAAVAGRTPEERERVVSRLEVLRRKGIAAIAGAARERWFTEEFASAHPEKVEARIAELAANDPNSYAEAYRIFGESDLAGELHEIEHETLVLTGERDAGSNPRMARLMHERISRSRLVILPRLKHSLLVEAPELIADHLKQFLSGPA